MVAQVEGADYELEEQPVVFKLTQETVDQIISTHVSHPIRIDESDVLDEVATVRLLGRYLKQILRR